MKYVWQYLLAILVIGWSLTRQKITEGYSGVGSGTSKGASMNMALYALSELKHRMTHINNPNPPPSKNMFCNPDTGGCDIYTGDPAADGAPELQTLAECNASCKYEFTNAHKNVCGGSNNNIDKWKSMTNKNRNVFLPTPVGKCPLGCAYNPKGDGVGVGAEPYKCLADFMYDAPYGDPDRCKRDIDCSWCTYKCDD